MYRTSYARVTHSTVTDTELQIGQFVLPKYGYGVTNDTVEARYLRAWKEELPEVHVSVCVLSWALEPRIDRPTKKWLPHAYMPSEGGVNGHQYDKFGTVSLLCAFIFLLLDNLNLMFPAAVLQTPRRCCAVDLGSGCVELIMCDNLYGYHVVKRTLVELIVHIY